jgi:hypothetical protein
MSKPVTPVRRKGLNSDNNRPDAMPSRMSTMVPSPVALTVFLAIRPSPSPGRIHMIMDTRHS